MAVRAYIGLGSNLADPVRQVQRAFDALEHIPGSRVAARSGLYRSRPLGPQDQPDFINAVAALDTELSPVELLRQLQSIELQHGRDRSTGRWGPRTLDLDLLSYADLVRAEPELRLPHPGAHERDFVLVPWCEIAPEAIIPGQGAVCELARRRASHDLVSVDSTPTPRS
jgi:2-amino-4-hydroxy-6-hydroxymethyldihydropteridine diphosphokinase